MNHQGTKRIETDRLILRQFNLEDANHMYNNWASDPEVTKYLTWPVHASPDATAELLKVWVKGYENQDYYSWAIELKDIGEAIGSISVVNLDENVSSAEIGYCIGKRFWSKGLMVEAFNAIIKYLFDTICCNRICARHDVNNPASGKVMLKCGLKYEGTARQADRNNQGICDCASYAVLKSDMGKK